MSGIPERLRHRGRGVAGVSASTGDTAIPVSIESEEYSVRNDIYLFIAIFILLGLSLGFAAWFLALDPRVCMVPNHTQFCPLLEDPRCNLTGSKTCAIDGEAFCARIDPECPSTQCSVGLTRQAGGCFQEGRTAETPCVNKCYKNSINHHCDGKGGCDHAGQACMGECNLNTPCPQLELNEDIIFINEERLKYENFRNHTITQSCEQDSYCFYTIPLVAVNYTNQYYPEQQGSPSWWLGNGDGTEDMFPIASSNYGVQAICENLISNDWAMKDCLKVNVRQPVWPRLRRQGAYQRLGGDAFLDYPSPFFCQYYFTCMADIPGMVMQPQFVFSDIDQLCTPFSRYQNNVLGN